MFKRLFPVAALLLAAAFFSKPFAQGLTLADWTVLSDENKQPPLTDTVFMGKPCVKLDGKSIAAIWNKKMNLRNFRIEFDMAAAVMAGLGFRASDEQNYQFLYFRPGYGNTIEAIQYIPIYNGALSWVFYGAYQASADIKGLQWFHAAIEVRGDELKVFTKNGKNADMNIRMQRTEADKGSVLFRTMFGTAYLANLAYFELPDQVTDWEISEQLPATGTTYGYDQVKKVKQWKAVNEPGDAYVNLSRYFKMPEGAVIARHTIHCDNDEAKYLTFDFTGTMKVYLDGKEVYNYEKYKLDRVEADTYRIRLALHKGNNELVFITHGDGFIFGIGFNSLGRIQHQNWGFIAALINAR